MARTNSSCFTTSGTDTFGQWKCFTSPTSFWKVKVSYHILPYSLARITCSLEQVNFRNNCELRTVVGPSKLTVALRRAWPVYVLNLKILVSFEHVLRDSKVLAHFVSLTKTNSSKSSKTSIFLLFLVKIVAKRKINFRTLVVYLLEVTFVPCKFCDFKV